MPGLAIARLNELHDGAGRAGGNRGQLDQSLCIFQLAVFKLQLLLFQGADELLGMPALLLPTTRAPSHFRTLDLMGAA